MSQKQFWYGYLEAGEKSSPVLVDGRLDTGNPQTVYMYNLKRDEIIEYRRDIVEPKLREISDENGDEVKALKSGFGKAKRDFQPRGARIAQVAKRTSASEPASRSTSSAKETEEYEEDIDADDIDEDWDDDED